MFSSGDSVIVSEKLVNGYIIYINKQVVKCFLFFKILYMNANNKEHIRIVLAGNIKKHRKKFGYSQEKLAEKAGLSAQTLNDIEGCRRWISAKTMTKLAKALNIDEYQLLIPEDEDIETDKDTSKSSLRSLISLQNNIINTINIQFDKAKDTGDFI